ncbi:hypothetical protein [Shimia sp. MIT1388]|uniref:hypothetical protein n=1 Tax=Shimia sp. MIT1388 TaxID=3096992 RepID=UPI0039995DF0
MNDDLYGYELEDGESISYAHPPGQLGNYGAVKLLAFYFGLVFLVSLAAIKWPALDAVFMAPRAGIPGVILLLLAFTLSGLNWRWLKRSELTPKMRPIVLTNKRLLLPNGNDMALTSMISVRVNFSGLRIEGDKLANGLTLIGLSNVQNLKTAIERQLT